MFTRILAALGLLSSVASCDAARDVHADVHRDVPASSAQPLPTAIAPSLPPASRSRLPLPQQLEQEAARRPAMAVRGEALQAAAGTHAIEIVRARQVLAQPVGALYCTLLQSAHGLGATVCEYADDATAAAGERTSRARFDAVIPGRMLSTNGSSLLTLTPPATKAAAREAELLRAAFAALTAAALQPG